MVPQFKRPSVHESQVSNPGGPTSTYRAPPVPEEQLLSKEQLAAMNAALRAQNNRTDRAVHAGGRRMAGGWTIAFCALIGVTFVSLRFGISQLHVVGIAVAVLVVIGAIGMGRGRR